MSIKITIQYVFNNQWIILYHFIHNNWKIELDY